MLLISIQNWLSRLECDLCIGPLIGYMCECVYMIMMSGALKLIVETSVNYAVIMKE